ncbi:T9SS type A sorting domain-containing protein [Hymenobacter psychrotolerans]|uniref:Por secretion system C-terminal sorting domain-containing protein n=1 Tax=Hymenobacter psychrotolerans DSM 18569 TaxID=1121959 RepID=A0A1M6WK25_9BACT|nr:T9SS type A sorting domain-containing protein [Hymenobacter psychrotolerans]SHK93949.1 Por secretion system C-terminal sorting domain-containing protein [Hymenobacter psychrotolerans DSM 18569]
MQHRYPLFFSLLLAGTCLAARAQSPVITAAAMPVPNDTLRRSTASVLLPATAPPLTQRGANQTWNYSALVPTAQQVARFGTVPNEPLYTFTFNSVLSGSNRATVASPQSVPLPPGFTLPITEPYQFFNASAADFRSVGYGGKLAGTAVPVTYASAARQDVIYRFPLSFASAPDSSTSFFSINVPGTGFLSQERKRVNKVDAWGSLTTPFGTYQTVRVVSRIEDHDSLSAGGISQGFDLPIVREYKWLAVGQHVPLLTITTTQAGTQEVVSGVEYRDVYRRLGTLGTGGLLPEAALRLFPNPSGSSAPLHLTLPAAGPVAISATDLAGRLLFRHTLAATSRETELPASLFGAFRGVLLLRVQTETGVAVRRIVRD